MRRLCGIEDIISLENAVCHRTFDYFHFTLDMKYAFSSFCIKRTELGEVWNAKKRETQSCPLRANNLKGKIRNVCKWSFIVNLGSSLPKHCKSAKKRYCVLLGWMGRLHVGGIHCILSQKMVRISIGSHGAAVILHRRKWYIEGYGVGNAQHGNTE